MRSGASEFLELLSSRHAPSDADELAGGCSGSSDGRLLGTQTEFDAAHAEVAVLLTLLLDRGMEPGAAGTSRLEYLTTPLLEHHRRHAMADAPSASPADLISLSLEQHRLTSGILAALLGGRRRASRFLRGRRALTATEALTLAQMLQIPVDQLLPYEALLVRAVAAEGHAAQAWEHLRKLVRQRPDDDPGVTDFTRHWMRRVLRTRRRRSVPSDGRARRVRDERGDT